MPKTRSKKSASKQTTSSRKSLPSDLEERLRATWRTLGPSIEWCDGLHDWLQRFRSELRPYRETFYWETVARIVADYRLEHPEASPERVLSDCLVATQSPAASDDPERLVGFRKAWEAILQESRKEIADLVRSDLALAEQEGTRDSVAALYAPENRTWDGEVPG